MHAYSICKCICIPYLWIYVANLNLLTSALRIASYTYTCINDKIVFLVNILIIISAYGQTIQISGNQTVIEGSNVTFNCTVTADGEQRRLRSNWLIVFPGDRNMNNIRLQGGNYTPVNTDRSLFHVPNLFPGIQMEFTFVRISSMFDMAEVQCFNGGATNSSFIDVISMYPLHKMY